MRAALTLIPLLSLSLSMAATANECQYEAARDFQLDLAGVQSLAVELGSFDIHAQGVPGLNHIEVHGRACASDPAWLDGLVIDQTRSGERVTLTPAHPRRDNAFGWFHSNYAYIDLEVRMPPTLLLDLHAGSGDAIVSDLGAVNFSAGSGDLVATHLGGALTVKVGSGDVQARDIASIDVTSASSGDVGATAVHGDAHVERIGSGDVQFSDVDGAVRVDRIGSGDVTASRVRGDVMVGSIGSGDVSVDGVAGNFTVSSKGSGDVHSKNVTGQVSVPERH